MPTGVAATRPLLRQPTTALGALPRGQTLLANSTFKEKTLCLFSSLSLCPWLSCLKTLREAGVITVSKMGNPLLG